MATYTDQQLYDAASALGLMPTDRSLHLLINNPQAVTAHGDGMYVIPSSRNGEEYTVTADSCGCPAYTEPVAAGDSPRLCYHRKAVMVLERAAQDEQARLDRARREAAYAAYRATLAAGVVPDPPGVPLPDVVLPGLPQQVVDETKWLEFQQRKGMLITAAQGRASALGARDAAKDKREGRA